MFRRNWDREELIIAFNIYCKIPFTKIHYTNPQIVEVAKIIGRSPSALALKLVNFARLDPELQKRNIIGMKHGSKSEELIWHEFNNDWEELSYQSELLLAKFKKQPVEKVANIYTEDLPKEGKDKETIVKTRVNQTFFRNMVLASYDNRCCVTGLSIPELLVASHIIPWSKDKKNRLNPRNGLCLNVLHDKAFDTGLLTITPDHMIKLSNRLLKTKDKEVLEKFFFPFADRQIRLPQRFTPDIVFLKFHNNNIFLDRRL